MSKTLVWQLAKRYLKGKRKANAVPILSRISMVAIAVSTCAMIILFSVFNGFEFIVRDLYKAFYPELKVTAAKGKFFSIDETQQIALSDVNGIKTITKVLEDNVLLNSYSEQKVATIKGVDSNYFKVNDVAPYMIEGDTKLSATEHTAIAGTHLLNQLGIDPNDAFSSIRLYYPNAQVQNISLSPEKAFQTLILQPTGSFRIQDEFDSKYIIADLSLVQQLLQVPNEYSSIELLLNDGVDDEDVKEKLQSILGNDYVVATRFEQNRILYMVMRSEKWAVFAILTLVMMIASFNMVGALSLLVLEKQKDMSILRAMGAQRSTVRNIFISEGMLWSVIGGGTGLLVGLLICLGQMQFGWIKLQGAFIINAYPVKIIATDFLLIIAAIVTVGLLASWFPAYRAAKVEALSLKSD